MVRPIIIEKHITNCISCRLAILGLTYQYTTSRISRETYETHYALYYDEVFRLNPQPADSENGLLISLNSDDNSIRTTEELRFMLFRHWTLYDAMFHSSYVAGKLGIWKEKGRQKLTGLLAKMGYVRSFDNSSFSFEPLPNSFSIQQTQQPYPHMDMDLKKMLTQKLNDIAPEHGLVELSYPSFTKRYGFRSQPLSAADAVEGISALLALAEGTRMEVEIEGTRNGGDWFGGGKIWEVGGSERNGEREQESGNTLKPQDHAAINADADGEVIEKDGPRSQEVQWWVKNFWTAYDSLAEKK
jgi:cell division control protein 45